MSFRSRFGRASSSKKAIQVLSHIETDSWPELVVYNSKQLRNDAGETLGKDLKRKLDAIEAEERDILQGFETGGCSRSPSPNLMNDVLDGTSEWQPSHAGREFLAILLDDSENEPKRRDYRTRRDRTQNVVDGFSQQLEEMTDSFVQWEYASIGSERAPVPTYHSSNLGRSFYVVDIFSASLIETDVEDSNTGIASELIMRGILPSSPYHPKHAFSIRLIEIYRFVHLRCPHLSIEAFVKSFCDMHGQPYKQPLAKQFTIAYDVYLQIRENIQHRVAVALKRDQDRWRLKNACSACTYKVEGESPLKFSMLVTMDGNDSLKRVIRNTLEVPEVAGQVPKTTLRELPDSRKPSGDYYLSPEEVNHFAREEPKEAVSPEDDSPCAPRWNNMNTDKISRMWGVFDESGFFLSLCRHGFTLVAADMVQSGEQSKYPLAVVNALMDAFGSNLGVGYDIGCRFAKTISTSSIGPRAKELNLTSLVGSFHGHAHNRICQLSNLATYVVGMGLEDLEGCERFFSKSNALASSLRYASKYHRQQKIVEYMKHMDKRESSQQLSEFLVRNYRQALHIIKGEEELRVLMYTQGVDGFEVFSGWLEEELHYLNSLTKEPTEETLEIAYYTKLNELSEAEKNLEQISNTFVTYVPGDSGRSSMGIKRYHCQERLNNITKTIHELEDALGVEERWIRGGDAWNRAENLAKHRNYQRSLDNLERLVVQRMFELTRMNMSQTGYKLRKHIAKALRTRSEAIRVALHKYNEAAESLRPPRPTLTWETVVEYSFLSDFDLLRDARQDIRQKPWASPIGRAMMDQYFRIMRAHEEIARLNIEIQRVITHLHDESNFLDEHETRLRLTDPPFAHQIHMYSQERLRYRELHMSRFEKLRSLKGFCGTLEPGISIDPTLRERGKEPGMKTHGDAREDDSVCNEDNVCDNNDSEDNVDSDSEDELAERFDSMMAVCY